MYETCKTIMTIVLIPSNCFSGKTVACLGEHDAGKISG